MSLAIEAGADAAGMIFGESPRRIDWEAAAQIARRLDAAIITPVAVFVNPEPDAPARVLELFPDALVQFSGDESPEFVEAMEARVIKAIHVGNESPQELADLCDRYPRALPLFDTKVAGAYGGTGKTFDWRAIAPLARWRPLMIAGGLTPENVGDCVRVVRPFGVDVRTGVETDGRKDPVKMRRFVRAVRENDAT